MKFDRGGFAWKSGNPSQEAVADFLSHRFHNLSYAPVAKL
jgi:hypothetical protein